METTAFELDAGTCDRTVNAWPSADCGFPWSSLAQAWNASTEGVHDTATASVLLSSGEAITERLVAFRAPDTDGRRYLLDQRAAL